MNAITASQAALFGFLVRFVREHGYPPTIREMNKWMGCTSNSTRDALRALIKNKYVHVDENIDRGIRILRMDVLVKFRDPSTASKPLQAQTRDLQPEHPKDTSICLGKECKECVTHHIDPVCLLHCKKKSEHHCLYCCICFKTLVPEECWVDEKGQRWDICKECGEEEERYGREQAEKSKPQGNTGPLR